MSQGLLELLGSMATLVFALPLVLAGAELLLRGNRLLGIGLLGAGLGMVVVDQHVTTLGNLPVLVAGKVAGTIAKPLAEE